ncbi:MULTISPECIES: hypothetical protein [Streptomyces]|uniref:DUF4190 domain-containing protein n=1 Tax=Streptomyces evansiae TaxID=3075535 RepID=A0ABU2R640_9ACTN|nr:MULTISPECIES: hypothetical protein [unclassified Streptomyces]MDT0412152.1 hypothetical protein [Streptomyces sp. DSM 41979]MYQ56034.1 hypothetical protein [Streptomyces sp. SID4926]WEH30499.1 hypothetical protein P0D76_26000 [Streptomyces sp. AM 3-1-1]SCD51155.1 hypothetical protein GA0115252_108120 [Streptomyces sp. DfronAA-171]
MTFSLSPGFAIALLLAVATGFYVNHRSVNPETRRGDVATAIGVAAAVFMALALLLSGSTAGMQDEPDSGSRSQRSP